MRDNIIVMIDNLTRIRSIRKYTPNQTTQYPGNHSVCRSSSAS